MASLPQCWKRNPCRTVSSFCRKCQPEPAHCLVCQHEPAPCLMCQYGPAPFLVCQHEPATGLVCQHEPAPCLVFQKLPEPLLSPESPSASALSRPSPLAGLLLLQQTPEPVAQFQPRPSCRSQRMPWMQQGGASAMPECSGNSAKHRAAKATGEGRRATPSDQGDRNTSTMPRRWHCPCSDCAFPLKAN